ncbi:hypothetical protein GPZ77_34570 (plasmid) [Streptomyces sp. QHH-9511]|uniref:DUF6221 family protein n=1 Tax=Streptomyces sp. QHH-9511 TaxID=2684468 RepID=UPI0013160C54|nr:DUF6221 family protein [Streptomyces sp. QHH-9511]QGZ53357.1 hypothetical protein GPZ77_34570 [Streptomyces sp. QHH-9511]
MTDTPALTRFLNDRLDDDEQIARAATQGEWVWSREFVTPPGYHHRTVGPLEPGDAAFIAHQHPARVLAEVDAKRRLVEASAVDCPPACGRRSEHSFSGSCALRSLGPAWEEDGARWVSLMEERDGKWVHVGRVPAPAVTSEWVLRLLALPYADHADYQDAWRP